MGVYLRLFNNQRIQLISLPPSSERGKHIMALEPEIVKYFSRFTHGNHIKLKLRLILNSFLFKKQTNFVHGPSPRIAFP